MLDRKFDNIYLIGPMGAGKTTIGKMLAELSELTYFDSDKEIEQRCGVEISWIFEREGEAGFRRREQETIGHLTQMRHIVLSTGGGVVLDRENCEALKSTGLVVYLRVSIDIQLQRITKNLHKRPVFAAHPTKQQLQIINQFRKPLYEKIADVSYSSDNLAVDKLAKKILADWKKFKISQERKNDSPRNKS